MAIAGLVLGLVSVIIPWIPGINWVGFLTSVAGAGVSFMAMKQVKDSNQATEKMMATAGLVLSVVGVVFSIIGTACYCTSPARQVERAARDAVNIIRSLGY